MTLPYQLMQRRNLFMTRRSGIKTDRKNDKERRATGITTAEAMRNNSIEIHVHQDEHHPAHHVRNPSLTLHFLSGK